MTGLWRTWARWGERGVSKRCFGEAVSSLVLVHIADPPAHFEALSAENERLEQLLAHPDWHYADPKFPRFEVLIEALEHLVVQHPETTFIGAHVGCYAQDLGWVGSMLDRCPKFFLRGARSRRETASSDETSRIAPPDEGPVRDGRLPAHQGCVLTYFRFFETDDEHFPYSQADPPRTGRWAISGVHLPDAVLTDVYRANAQRIIPALSGL